MDTIFAPATAQGKAGVAIVRLSGPEAWAAVARLTPRLPSPRVASLRRLSDASGDLLDEALLLLFDEGQSFTGEEMAELHLHGSHAVVKAVLEILGGMPGLRIAAPGEFTRRAFHNGRLDLTQVEGLADLIEAETQAQRKQASRVLSGAIGARAAEWRGRLLRGRALIEAMIDFADDELPDGLIERAVDEIRPVLASMQQELAGSAAAERIRDGFEVAIVGPPNAGKSTLLNAIAGRDAAITSEHAGTTRDVLEVRLELAGHAVTLLDMAGLRESADAVEKLGVARAKARAAAADLRVFLLPDAGCMTEVAVEDDDIVVRAKGDRVAEDVFKVSGLTGEGVEELLAAIGRVLGSRVAGAATITHARHASGLRVATEMLERIVADGGGAGREPELIAEDLRSVIHTLDSLVGRVDVEEILGEIFGTFCIGK